MLYWLMQATRAIIHIDNFIGNLQAVRAKIGPNRAICVPVKADAYGHGSIRIMRTAVEAGAAFAGVSSVTEGAELRSGGISCPIILFSQPVFEEIPATPQMGNVPPTFGSQADPFAGTNFGSPNFASGNGIPRQLRLEDLPGYARSVLKVKVPVATILARARKPIKAILELGVGSIIQFEKSYDEMLEVEVGQAIVIATAEAVKVGDKFGFRISTVMLPEERFRRVEVRREGEYIVKSDSPQIIGKAPIKSFDKKR